MKRDRISVSVKDDISHGKQRIVYMFLDKWLMEDCVSSYTIDNHFDPVNLRVTFDIHLDSLEDATFLKLKGIPCPLRGFVSLH